MLSVLGRRSRAGVLGGLLALLVVGFPTAADVRPFHPIGQVIRNLTYCRDDGDPQRLDLLYPTVRAALPRPLILWVHGGTWVTGSKDSGAGRVYIQALRRAGFIVAAMNYSLAPSKRFPAMTQDLTCGVRFLRANSRKYGIDPKHIGAMGGSAGGHLVQMLGVDNGDRTFVDGGYSGYSSRVQAVASLWGVSDLTRHDLGPSDEKKLPSIFGRVKRWAAASPIRYVRRGLPPFLLVHGSRDSDVPVSQSKLMYWALRAHKVPATLVVIKDAEHGLKPAGGRISPTVGTVPSRLVRFFTWAFKR